MQQCILAWQQSLAMPCMSSMQASGLISLSRSEEVAQADGFSLTSSRTCWQQCLQGWGQQSLQCCWKPSRNPRRCHAPCQRTMRSGNARMRALLVPAEVHVRLKHSTPQAQGSGSTLPLHFPSDTCYQKRHCKASLQGLRLPATLHMSACISAGQGLHHTPAGYH